MKIYKYERISKKTSNLDNQEFQIDKYSLDKYGRVPDISVKDVITGRKKAAERGLGKIIQQMQKDDVLLIAHTSRFGRDYFDVIYTAGILYEKGASFYSIQQNFDFGKGNEMAKLMLGIYAQMDEWERDNTSKRNKAVIQREKTNGTYSGGRPEGTIKEPSERQLKEINRLLDKGEYVIETLAKFAAMTRQTFSKYLKLHPELESKRVANLPRNRRGG